MRQIVLAPWGGLCNRMSAILSAIETQKVTGMKFTVVWDNVHLCKCDFDDLFYPLDMSSLGSEYDSMEITPLRTFHLHPDRRFFYFLPDVLRKFTFNKCFEGYELQKLDFAKEMSKYDKVYIRACAPLSPCQLSATIKVSDIFRPKPDIIEKIKKVTENFGDNIIGIHIRRTDHVNASNQSPMELFYKMMDEEIQNDNSVKFYVASDDEDCKNEMKNRYGDRIVTAVWNLSRDSVEGMKDAVAELYCLGATKKIIGSAGSTYSNMAARLNAIKVVKAKIEK